jgi:hypothetical protein
MLKEILLMTLESLTITDLMGFRRYSRAAADLMNAKKFFTRL